MLTPGVPADDGQHDRVLEVEAEGRAAEGHAHSGKLDQLAAVPQLGSEEGEGGTAAQDRHRMAALNEPTNRWRVRGGVPKAPDSDGKKHAAFSRRAPSHQR